MHMTPVPIARRSLATLLATQITTLIRSGRYRAGECLPPMIEIARRCGVSQPTVRVALARLESLGLVEVRQGSGVYVRAQPARQVRVTPSSAVPGPERANTSVAWPVSSA